MPNFMLDDRRLTWLGAVLGALLALWVIYQNGGEINNDGILYLEAAKWFVEGEWPRGVAVYAWPLYPMLIASTHQLTGLELQAAAHLLAMLFFALTCAGTMMLVREVGGTRRVMGAGLLLLLCSPYLVATVVPMIVRDQGFWAAHVWSLIFLIRFSRSNRLAHALAWGSCAILATLFRIEGLTYLALLPTVFLTRSQNPWKQRLLQWLKAHALLGVVAIGLAGLLALKSGPAIEDLGRLAEPMEIGKKLYAQLAHIMERKGEIYGRQVLGDALENYALPGLVLTLAWIALTKAAGAAGWLQFALAVFGAGQRRKPEQEDLFAGLLLLGLLNAGVILLYVFLLPKRYVLPIGFVILVYAAFGLVALLEASAARFSRGRTWNWAVSLALAALLLQAVDVLWKTDAGVPMDRQAGQWMRANVDPNSRIFYGTSRLRYYTTGETLRSDGKGEAKWPHIVALLSSAQLGHYDYLMLRSSRKKPEERQYLTERLGQEPLVVFSSGRTDQVLIYRVNKPSRMPSD